MEFSKKRTKEEIIVLILLKIIKKNSKKPIPRVFFWTEWLKPAEVEHSDGGMV